VDTDTDIEKRFTLGERRAARLERLARAQHTTESALVEKALDLLFDEQADALPVTAGAEAEWDLLRRLDAENGGAPPPRPRIEIDPAEIVSFVGTPIKPGTLRRSKA
jgi:hypothetical protein